MSIDAFDELFDAATPQATPTTDYSVIPEGRAEVEIVAASIGDVAWKVNDKNPTGACLRLRLSAGRQHAFVFVDLPKDRHYLFKALAAALGIAPNAEGKVTLPQPHELVGRSVAVEIGHYQSKAGATKASVRKWLPAEQQPTRAKSDTPTLTAAIAAWERDDRQEQRQPQPQQRPVNRSRNAVPQYGADDDIPF